jgi:hypothetical protein
VLYNERKASVFLKKITSERIFERRPYSKNPYVHTAKSLDRCIEETMRIDNARFEIERLAQRGFTADEILSLFWLRQWYQNGGSDRVVVLRHLEFLKLLVLGGKMEP